MAEPYDIRILDALKRQVSPGTGNVSWDALRGAPAQAAATPGSAATPTTPTAAGVSAGGEGIAKAAEAAKPGALRTVGKVLGIGGGVLSAADAIGKTTGGETVEQQDALQSGGGRNPTLRGALAEYSDSMFAGQGRAIGTALGAGAARVLHTPGSIFKRIGAGIEGVQEGWDDAKNNEKIVAAGNKQLLHTPFVEPAQAQGGGKLTDPVELRGQAAKPATPAAGTMSGTVAGVPEPQKKAQSLESMLAQEALNRETAGLIDRSIRGPRYQPERTLRTASTRAPITSERGEDGVINIRGGEVIPGTETRVPAVGQPGDGNGVAAGLSAVARLGLQGQQRKVAEKVDKLNLEAGRQQTELAKAGLAQQNANRDFNMKQTKASVDNYARSVTPMEKGEDPKAYESKVAKLAADVNRSLEFTASRMTDARGNRMSIEDMGSNDRANLLVMKDWVAALKDTRSGFSKTVTDYWGSKRWDSLDLNDAMPVGYGKMADGSPAAVLANGEKVPGSIVGGEFRLFGANDAINAQFSQLMKQGQAMQAAKDKAKEKASK